MTTPDQHSSNKLEHPVEPQSTQNDQQSAAHWSSDQENAVPQSKNIVLSAKPTTQRESFNTSIVQKGKLQQIVSEVADKQPPVTVSLKPSATHHHLLSPKADAKKTTLQKPEQPANPLPDASLKNSNPTQPPQTCTEAWASSNVQPVLPAARTPLAEIQKDSSEWRENNRVTLQDQAESNGLSTPIVKVNITVAAPAASKADQEAAGHPSIIDEGAPKKQQKAGVAGYPKNHHQPSGSSFGNAGSASMVINLGGGSKVTVGGESTISESKQPLQMVRLRSAAQVGQQASIAAESSLTMSECSADAVAHLASAASQMSQTTDQVKVAKANAAASVDMRSEADDGVESTTAYNRKEKSLGELCRRFLFLYGTPQRGLLYLDQCTRELGVERRRIYDIINILESFSVIQRCAKNEYQWRGIDKIVSSIEKQIQACKEHHLNSAASANGKNNKIPANLNNSQVIVDDDSSMLSSDTENHHQMFNQQQQENNASGTRSKSRTGAKRSTASGRGGQKTKQAKYKKVKSLGNFCQQFIRLFVTWKDVLSLEEAAKQISDGEIFDEKLLKTKIRRLYDIANVLQSIGLIHKTQMSNSRKPAFKWIGLRGVILAIQEIKLLVRTAQQELNSNYSNSVKSQNNNNGNNYSNSKKNKDQHQMLGVNWLVKQNSVRCPPSSSSNAAASNASGNKGSQSKTGGRGGIQSPPQPSPLKLKRSASFIEASPAKGSLIVEQRKRQWAMQQKLAMANQSNKMQQSVEQQSEGNILEVQNQQNQQQTTSAFGRKQPQMMAFYQELNDDESEDQDNCDDQDLLMEDVPSKKPAYNNPDKVQLFVSSSSNAAFAAVGKKRPRRSGTDAVINKMMTNSDHVQECEIDEDLDEEDSFMTDQDMRVDQEIQDEQQSPPTTAVFVGGRNNAAVSASNRKQRSGLLVAEPEEDERDGPYYEPQNSSMTNTIVKLNKQEEEALIRELESEAMGNDTLKELDEALMDRSTAQKTLRNKTNFMSQHAKINSSNFKCNQEPAQVIKKLKQMSAAQQQAQASSTNIVNASSVTLNTANRSSPAGLIHLQVAEQHNADSESPEITSRSRKSQQQTSTHSNQRGGSSQMIANRAMAAQTIVSEFKGESESEQETIPVAQLENNGGVLMAKNQRQPMTSLVMVKHAGPESSAAAMGQQLSANAFGRGTGPYQSPPTRQFHPPMISSATNSGGSGLLAGSGSRRKAKQTDKKESQIVKVLGRAPSQSHQLDEGRDQDEDEVECLPVVLHSNNGGRDQQRPQSSHRRQMSATSNQTQSCSNREYLLSLQSFRFCLRSLPLIKQLSAGMLEQRTTISKSSHTANDASSQSSQLSIVGH